MKKTSYSIIVATAVATLAFNACKKKEESAPKPQAKIAYAVYGAGVYDTTASAKVAEYLNRGEMVTVVDTVNAADPKNAKKTISWAKIERTTGKQGFVVSSYLENKAFVVLRPLEVFNINQAAGKRLATVPPGQVGFIAEEKGEWAKVRFGYNIYEDWTIKPEAKKWVDNRWAQVEGVSYDPVAIGQGVELDNALQKFNDKDAKKQEAGKKELQGIISDGKSPFIAIAQKALDTEVATPSTPTETPAADQP